MSLDNDHVGGKILEGNAEIGEIKEWATGRRIAILWHPKSWENATTNEVVISFSANGSGSTVVIEQRDWDHVLGNDGEELLGWFVGQVVVSLLSASAPSQLGDWITDRGARRPSGARARGFYRKPVYHWPNFLAILDVLTLTPNDNLLEVGCGGGAFLQEALKSGCRASAIDHSLDMVGLASEVNRDSIMQNRLKISVGDAGALPYADRTFSCAVMTGVFNFLPDPIRALKEVCRVLNNGGRLVVFGASKVMRGTPAAPEPMASRLHFYDDGEMEEFARLAGFDVAKIEHPSLFENAKKVGVPESDLGLFKGTTGSQLLVARKT